MEPLQLLGQKWNTSKITAHSYAAFYESILEPLRNEPINFLEIGILYGHSLLMWLEYFPNAQIHGIDASDFQWFQHPRLTTYNCPVQDERLSTLFEPTTLDVIVDDASHVPEQQHMACHRLWAALKPGGWYIVEDIFDVGQLPAWEGRADYRVHRGTMGPDDVIVAFRRPA